MAKPRKNSVGASSSSSASSAGDAGATATATLKPKRTRTSVPRESPSQRTSVYRGVTRHRWTGRFEAHLWDKNTWSEPQRKKKGRQVYLGAYGGEEAAARAYDLAALKYWGRDTVLNFPLSNYDQELKEMEEQSREEYIGSLRRKSAGFSRGVSKYRGVASLQFCTNPPRPTKPPRFSWGELTRSSARALAYEREMLLMAVPGAAEHQNRRRGRPLSADLLQNCDLPPPAKLLGPFPTLQRLESAAGTEGNSLLRALRLSQSRARRAEEKLAVAGATNNGGAEDTGGGGGRYADAEEARRRRRPAGQELATCHLTSGTRRRNERTRDVGEKIR